MHGAALVDRRPHHRHDLAGENITGEDPSWFAAFGIPGNLAILVGSIMGRVRREDAPGRLLAVLLVLSVPASLLGAEVGGPFVAAALWALVAAGAVHARLRFPAVDPLRAEAGL